tara:strand:- start:9843 stop:9995 length:153 start_codon:yes stop_codon:yes gene_type:complete
VGELGIVWGLVFIFGALRVFYGLFHNLFIINAQSYPQLAVNFICFLWEML